MFLLQVSALVHLETMQTSNSLFKRQATGNLTAAQATLFTFTGPVQFGTPGQTMRCIFDSGSFDLWTRDTGCTSNQCVQLAKFNASQSSTFKSTGQAAKPITYADGTNITGSLATDTVSIAGLGVPDVSFVQATGFNIRTADQDCIMGLGFPAKANGSYFAQLVASGKIKAPVFSYYITQNAKSGGLTLGGIDTARFGGDILWAPLVPESNNQFSYWKVAVTGVTAGPQGISLPPGFSMITDTGTSLSIFPKDVANAINTGLGLQKINDVYGIPCPNGTNALPPQLLNLTLSLATGNLVITPKEYLYQLPSNLILNQTICASTIIGGNTNVTLVGNAFLQRFYLVHDYGKKKLGFAVANRDVQVESQFVELDSTNPPKGKWQSPETYPPGSNTTETTLKNSASVYSATLLSAVVALILMH